ncbi:MAG: phosphatidate cytidylyltransferase, partial [Thermodesulfobacteriota bacterium]
VPPAPGRTAVLGLGLLPLVTAAASGRLEAVAAAVFFGLAVAALWTICHYPRLDSPLDFFLRLLLGVGYAGFLPAHLLLVVRWEAGGLWLLYLSAITAASDSGAYFAGRRFGRHKLCPAVSPGKTVEGLAGGMVAGLAAAALIGALALPAASLAGLMAWAVPIAALGVVGDLTESILKRAAGVKDSGHLLPGHGGILDRVDSLLFAAPCLYYARMLGWLS